MIVRLEPITAIIVAVLLGMAWNTSLAAALAPVTVTAEIKQFVLA